MRQVKFTLLLFFLAVAASASLVSCVNDDDNNTALLYPNALVTVKTDADGTVFLQLDEKTTLLPQNLKTSPFGKKEVRALTNISQVETSTTSKYDKTVHVNWIDSIRTKETVPTLGDKDAEKFGKDPVEIVNDWVTIAEDGYLTLRFRTLWGYSNIIHYVNLVTGTNPENPYEIEFRHDAKGDLYGLTKDALVAFDLKDLPDTDGKSVKLKLKWESYSGPKSTEFDYTTRKSSGGKMQLNNIQLAKTLE